MELNYYSQAAALRRDSRSGDRFSYINLMYVMLIFLGIFLRTWEGLYIGKIKCDIREADKSKSQLSQVNYQLRLERGSLASLSQIERQAKKQLRLMPPQSGQVVIIEQGP